jgi:hypothetical protein
MRRGQRPESERPESGGISKIHGLLEALELRIHDCPALKVRSCRAPILAIAAGALLFGCAPKQEQASISPPRVYAADVTGAAKSCEAPKVTLTDGKTTDAAIRMGNDGGWCAITVSRNGKPYDTFLLTTRPKHGRVLVHTVGDSTRIDYTPDRGYAGADAFTVKLIPGEPSARVTVAVSGS